MSRFSLLLLCSIPLFAQIHGAITDPSGAPIDHAQVHLLGGPERVAVTDAAGAYAFKDVPKGHYIIVASAPGLAANPVAFDYTGGDQTTNLKLALAAREESVEVTAQRTEMPAETVAASTTVITRGDLDQMHVENALEALRMVPGLVVSQTLDRGNEASIFARGGNSNMNLVLIDGVRVNDFGGGYNFANLPAENIERIEVVRGPQSALYGANAIGAVIQIITRRADGDPQIHGLIEGGSFGYVKGALGFGVREGKFSLSGDFMELGANGVVQNGDYLNRNASMALSYDVSANSRFTYTFGVNSNQSGTPGPYGSNPLGLFPGIDTISRSNETVYRHGFRYDFLAGRIHQTFDGGISDETYFFHSPYGDTLTTNYRASASSQTEITLTKSDSIVGGFEFQHEATTNTYISNPIDRDEFGFFVENRYQLGGRLFVNAGIRLEDIRTSGLAPRPDTSIFSPNPKLSVAFLPTTGSSTKLHGSVGTGLRPPDGFELAFTNNPDLKPERTTSFDAGIEQSFAGRRVVLDLTYFYNRFHDLIVTLGPTQMGLSEWQSANLANSRAQGLEFSYAVRPMRALRISGNYTFDPTRLLALDGGPGQAPPSYQVGQPLIRRPEHSASYDVAWTWRRLTVDTSGLFRSSVLDIEPNYGASAGLFTNPGYARADAGVEVGLTREVAIYGRLRNFTDARYEEVFGYPSERRNFVTGLKFNWGAKR